MREGQKSQIWVQWRIYYACSTPQVCCVHHALCCYFCCSVNPEKISWMWSWVFFELERMRMLSGIQFTRHFIVETKRFVSSNVNVILMRQICRQRSSMSAGSKRRVPTHLIRWKSALRSSIPFASPEVVHKPRSDSPLHFDSQNTCQIRMASTRLQRAKTLPQHPQVLWESVTPEDRVWFLKR